MNFSEITYLQYPFYLQNVFTFSMVIFILWGLPQSIGSIRLHRGIHYTWETSIISNLYCYTLDKFKIHYFKKKKHALICMWVCSFSFIFLYNNNIFVANFSTTILLYNIGKLVSNPISQLF